MSVSGVRIGERVGMDLTGVIVFIEIPISLETEFSSLDESVSGVYTGERVRMDLSRVIDFIEVPVSLLTITIRIQRERTFDICYTVVKFLITWGTCRPKSI